jgi:hypothetical protein
MLIKSSERREELRRLRSKLETAEQGRLAGLPTYTLEASRARLEKREGWADRESAPTDAGFGAAARRDRALQTKRRG